MFSGKLSKFQDKAGKVRFAFEFSHGQVLFDLFTQPTAKTSFYQKASCFLLAHSFKPCDPCDAIKHLLVEPDQLIILIWVPLIRTKLFFSAK